MPLLSLPNEILEQIISNLANLDDLHNLRLADKNAFSEIYLKLPSNLLYRIFQRSYENPGYLLLAAVKARQLSDWCSESPIRRETLNEFISGPETFCPEVLRILPLKYEELKTTRAYDTELLAWAVHEIPLGSENFPRIEVSVEENIFSKAFLIYEIYTQLFRHTFATYPPNEPPCPLSFAHSAISHEMETSRVCRVKFLKAYVEESIIRGVNVLPEALKDYQYCVSEMVGDLLREVTHDLRNIVLSSVYKPQGVHPLDSVWAYCVIFWFLRKGLRGLKEVYEAKQLDMLALWESVEELSDIYGDCVSSDLITILDEWPRDAA